MHRSRIPKPPLEAPNLLISLLGTRAAADRGDELGDPSSATAWLAGEGLTPPEPEVTEAERRRLVDLREGLHALLLAPRRQWTREAVRLFNRTIREAPLEVSVTVERTVRIASPDPTFDLQRSPAMTLSCLAGMTPRPARQK